MNLLPKSLADAINISAQTCEAIVLAISVFQVHGGQ